jgi:hypothetical protein
MNTFEKLGRCECCGDIRRVMNYNGNDACKRCLSMDRRGIERKEILDEIMGIEKPWKKRRKDKKSL